ncbi:uncharacterized protein [Mytilus edulis]|uniref:uncharacterized protein n=1 Tax=Mytilus edulis TaxID=6550 RepID=UPI0039F0A502
MDGFHHELSEDDMILSQVLETLEDEMELRNVNIEDFFGEFPSNVMDENASGDLINTSAVSFDLGLDLDLWLQVPSENGKIQNVKDEEPKDQEQGVESRFAEMTDNEIDTLIEDAENKTQRKPQNGQLMSMKKRTLATRLYQAGVSEQMIMDRTGHRSEKAVRTYKRPADSMLKDVSNILNPSNKQIKLEDPKPLTNTRAILPEQVNIENTENAFNVSKPEGKYRGLPSNSSFQNCVFNFVTKM